MNKSLLLCVSYDGGSKIPGARFAPLQIVKHLKRYDWPLFLKIDYFFIDFEIGIEETILDNLKAKYSTLYRRKEKVIVLGGDHCISYPLVQSILKKEKEINFIYIDAHSDLYKKTKKLKNWNVISAISQLKGVKLFNLGARREIDLLERKRIFHMGVEESLRLTPKKCLELFTQNPTYLSIDLDVLDPAFAPGVSDREGGGYSTRELSFILETLLKSLRIIGIDLVEYNPQRDSSDITLDSIRRILRVIVQEWKQ